jgi:hypothetical protein
MQRQPLRLTFFIMKESRKGTECQHSLSAAKNVLTQFSELLTFYFSYYSKSLLNNIQFIIPHSFVLFNVNAD